MNNLSGPEELAARIYLAAVTERIKNRSGIEHLKTKELEFIGQKSFEAADPFFRLLAERNSAPPQIPAPLDQVVSPAGIPGEERFSGGPSASASPSA